VAVIFLGQKLDQGNLQIDLNSIRGGIGIKLELLRMGFIFREKFQTVNFNIVSCYSPLSKYERMMLY